MKVIVIGGGIGGLTAAALLARDGIAVEVLEQNRVVGGCASSFYRQGYYFESGATTLVGLDDRMPLRHLLDATGIQLNVTPLPVPMQVILRDGTIVTRHQDLDAWIVEAERVFGAAGQRAFWEFCYELSQFVWNVSLQYRAFPPSSGGDLFDTLQSARPARVPAQLAAARYAYVTMDRLLRRFDLHTNRRFVEFVDEQLLITAQNTSVEVNALFGATALCYTNYTNYYAPGGLVRVADAIAQYIEDRGGDIHTRTLVEDVTPIDAGRGGYRLRTNRGTFVADRLISNVPIYNTLDLFKAGDDFGRDLRRRLQSKLPPSSKLWSAFTMGLVFRRRRDFASLHHQIHLRAPLPALGSKSIFVSLSHPGDEDRGPADRVIASVSTHIADPENHMHFDVDAAGDAVVAELTARGFFEADDLLYRHHSTPRTWQQWTRRAFGFVGGVPQFRAIKPWNMLDARLAKNLYLCGDTAYPGQGIPGVCLSGITAHHKLMRDAGRNVRYSDLSEAACTYESKPASPRTFARSSAASTATSS